MAAKSFMESNQEKEITSTKNTKEFIDQMTKYKEDFEKFRKLVDSKEWQECRDFIKDEIYKGLAINPGEPGVGDWWAKYVWGLKCFIERVEAHANKYDEAIRELSK